MFIFAHPVNLHGIRVKFVYEGHRVKVTAAKMVANACSCIDQLPSAIFICGWPGLRLEGMLVYVDFGFEFT